MAAAAAGSTTIPDQAATGPALPAPFPSSPGVVRPEWIDHNGHLNLAYFIVLLDIATDHLWQAIGLGETYRTRTGNGTFAVETHTLYLGELREGDDTRALSWVIAHDHKRLHIAHELRRTKRRHRRRPPGADVPDRQPGHEEKRPMAPGDPGNPGPGPSSPRQPSPNLARPQDRHAALPLPRKRLRA